MGISPEIQELERQLNAAGLTVEQTSTANHCSS
jgi:hypothetical protein